MVIPGLPPIQCVPGPGSRRFVFGGQGSARCAALLCALWIGAAALVGVSPAVAEPIAALSAQTTRLDNGLLLITTTDPESEVASVQVWYRGGTRLDPPGGSGLAHLFEHLLFDPGDPAVQVGHRAALQDLGGGAGAYTTPDALVLVNTAPAAALEACLRLEAQRMGSLRLAPEAFEKQRAYIRNERFAQLDSQPLAGGVQELLGLLYPSHPYRWSIFGRPGELEALEFETVEAYYEERMAPDQAILVVASPRSHEEILRLVKRHFGSLRASGATPAAPSREPEPTSTIRSTGQTALPFPILAAGFRAVSGTPQEARALEIAEWILAEGSNARLHRSLITEASLAFAVNGSVLVRIDPGSLQILVYVRPGAESAAVEEHLFAELARLAQEGPTPEELSVAQHCLETRSLYRLQTAEGRAQALGQAALTEGEAARAAERPDRWRAVTAVEVQQVARVALAPGRRCILWMMPSGGQP